VLAKGIAWNTIKHWITVVLRRLKQL